MTTMQREIGPERYAELASAWKSVRGWRARALWCRLQVRLQEAHDALPA